MSQQKLKQMKSSLMRGVIKKMKREKLKRQFERLQGGHGIHLKSKPQDWEIVKGDIVEVIRGRDEGKQGKVLQVYRRGESVIIDGINLRLHKTKDSAGQIETMYRPSRVMVKNVALVDQDTGIPTPVEWKFSQAAADKERYTRVRQGTVSGDLIQKPPEAKTKRKLRQPHETKDTKVRFANLRTWVGPWDLFTEEQKEWIISDAKEKLTNVASVETQLPELMYNNVEEVQDYIRMLPYCPHTFFKIGNCEPYAYEKETKKRWSKRRIYRNLRRGDGKKEYSEELIDELQDRPTFSRYLTHPVDPNSHWPRVHPDIDPMFDKYKNGYDGELQRSRRGKPSIESTRALNELAGVVPNYVNTDIRTNDYRQTSNLTDEEDHKLATSFDSDLEDSDDENDEIDDEYGDQSTRN